MECFLEKYFPIICLILGIGLFSGFMYYEIRFTSHILWDALRRDEMGNGRLNRFAEFFCGLTGRRLTQQEEESYCNRCRSIRSRYAKERKCRQRKRKGWIVLIGAVTIGGAAIWIWSDSIVSSLDSFLHFLINL